MKTQGSEWFGNLPIVTCMYHITVLPCDSIYLILIKLRTFLGSNALVKNMRLSSIKQLFIEYIQCTINISFQFYFFPFLFITQ